jgi:hypothetical protein
MGKISNNLKIPAYTVVSYQHDFVKRVKVEELLRA